MVKTIIQTIGPLYGEVVNGTVFGRPNGSVYVPISNTITQTLADSMKYLRNFGGLYYAVCTSSGTPAYADQTKQVHAVAESQDLQNYVVTQVSDSSDFTTILGTSAARPAGQFNVYFGYVATGADLSAIVADEKYYIRAVLMSANGEPVAVSDSIEVTGWTE